MLMMPCQAYLIVLCFSGFDWRVINQYVRMQIKRSPISNLNNNKQNTLIQPLIGISKASTPVRTRIIGGNSTPINPNKINNFHKSPNNKENHQTNHIKLEGCTKPHGITETENRINLSPILAINKKMNEGVKNQQQKKSLTPEGYKVVQEYQTMGMGNSGPNANEKNYQTLNDSKAFNGFNNTTNFSNMRTSNSFKNLIEARCKTPNRFEQHSASTISLLESKREGGPLLKQSASSNQLFKQFSRESKPKLTESRSFERFKPLSNLGSSEGSEIKCMNNDGKKAKYRVINEDSDEPNDMQLYYCSKCTVPLVQQGFKVEQIGKESIKQECFDQNLRWVNDYHCRLDSKKNSLEFVLKDINQREHESLTELNRYYNKINQFIESQRNADKRKLQEYYREKKSEPAKYLQDIVRLIEDLSANSKIKMNKSSSEIERILSFNQKQFIGDNSLEINSDVLLNNFVQIYNENLKINFEITVKNPSAQYPEPISSRNHAMRFSFEKLLTDIHHKKSNIQSMMNPLQEEDEEYNENEVEIVKESHTAFRDLFPEVEQAQHANTGIHSPTFKNF